jgi:hypothetical protein
MSIVLTFWESLTKCNTVPLHHKQQWQAATNTTDFIASSQWDLTKSKIICPNFQANYCTESASWVSDTFPEATARLGHDVG